MPELAGMNYERRNPDSSRPPLLLLHGLGSRLEVWTPVLDRLAAARDVIAVDLPGFGASPAPAPGTTPGIETFAVLVEEFLAQLGVQRPHVAGNSMGGWLALELARRGSVASATGLSPAGFSAGIDTPYTVSVLIFHRVVSQLSSPVAPYLFSSAAIRRLTMSLDFAHPEKQTPEEATLGLRGMAEATWFWPNLIALQKAGFRGGSEITVPVTIAWGAKDRLLRPNLAANALAEIPTAHFVSLPDCGHIPMPDNPELVAEVILKGSSGN